MSFTMETEQNNKILFLNASVIPEQGKFPTNIYRKPTFSGIFTHFYSSLSDPIPQIPTSGVVYKFKCGLCNEYCYGEL